MFQELPILLRNRIPVPVSITETFGTAAENQATVVLKVYETDVTDKVYEIGGWEPLGNATLGLPANLPMDSPIEVTIELSTDGLLHLKGREVTTGQECDATFESTAVLTEEEVQTQTAAIQGLVLK